MSTMHPPIQITDELDNPLRGASMDEAQFQGLWHRVTGVMVCDPRRKLYLLQKIAPNPYYSGGKWNLTSTGHVDEGETYIQAAERELIEEMGIKGLLLAECSYYHTSREAFSAGAQRKFNRHFKIFFAEGDASSLVVEPDRSEVDETIWMTEEELIDMYYLADSQITGTLKHFIETILLSRERAVNGR